MKTHPPPDHFKALRDALHKRGFTPSDALNRRAEAPYFEQLALLAQPTHAARRAGVERVPAPPPKGLARTRALFSGLDADITTMVQRCSEPERRILEARVGLRNPCAFPQLAACAARVLDAMGVTAAVALGRYDGGADDAGLTPTLNERVAVLTAEEFTDYAARMNAERGSR